MSKFLQANKALITSLLETYNGVQYSWKQELMETYIIASTDYQQIDCMH